MNRENKTGKNGGINRRDFMRVTAATGAGLILTPEALADKKEPAKKPKAPTVDPGPPPPVLNLAIIGAGSQGRILLDNSLRTPSIHVSAVCDIWSYSRKYATGVIKGYKQKDKPKVYTDYKEMLADDLELDAVLIATPDWMHAEQSIACMEKGYHVYCEKEMSNTLEGCRQMVLAARRTGKLLQIGHQRRSNPRYKLAEKLIYHDKLLGRITHFSGQWNRSQRLSRTLPKKYLLTKEELKKYGYGSMERFRNWRWYRDFSGGPMADLGSHQVDIFSWFLRANPQSVIAAGGTDYYEGSEWYDNIMSIYDYQTDQGVVRGNYQILNSTSHGGFYETFMGDQGSMVISEDTRKGFIFREPKAKRRNWEDDANRVNELDREAIQLKVGETRQADGSKAPETLKAKADAAKPPHQPHLENFFDAVRNGAELNCSSETAFETAVSVLRVNDAVATGERVTFKPGDFHVEEPKPKKDDSKPVIGDK